MLTAGTVASLTADIPRCDLLSVDVVANRMATVARRPSWSLQIVGRIKRYPPVGAITDEVLTPSVILDLPLSRQREIIVSDFRKISLFPKTTVDEGDLIQGEFGYGVRSEIGYQSFGMFSWIAYHVRHRSLLPSLVNLGMALLA